MQHQKNIHTNLKVIISNKEIFENSNKVLLLGSSATEKHMEKNTQIETLTFVLQSLQTQDGPARKCAFRSKPLSSQC